MSPCRGAQEDDDGENLQPAYEHGCCQQKLCRIGEKRIVIHRAYSLKAGADVGDAGKCGGKTAGKAVAVKGDQETDTYKDEHIADKKAVYGPEGAALQSIASPYLPYIHKKTPV